jgi:hypothetical protein
MNSNVVPYFFFGGMIAMVAAIITVSVHYSRKRTRELTEVAQQIAFIFVGNNWSGPPRSSQYNTCLLRRARGKFGNVMTGSANGLSIGLFDFTYPMGKSSITQTLASFSQELELPPFELRPEGVLDRIGDSLVHNDIDFDSHPDFSRRYLLRSPDEAAVRNLFTPSVLTYIEQLPADKKWHVEGTATTLIIYRGGSPISPFEMPSFLEETSSIARIIFGSDGLKKSGA